MNHVICDGGLPIKLWLDKDSFEVGALNQAVNLSKLPFAFRHIAIMPDSHLGYGMPIGGVLATNGVVIPSAVGVDIGCGMMAIKTSLKVSDVSPHLRWFIKSIEKVIPVGFNKHPDGVNCGDHLPEEFSQNYMDVIPFHYENALRSLGTLGGGNHFIEFQKSEGGDIWVMIHSGSRNIGKVVAEYYNKVAKRMNQEYFSSVPDSYDLAFFPVDSEYGRKYMEEMNACLAYAKYNRRHMMSAVANIIREDFPDMEVLEQYDVHHNYATMENHFGRRVMVHRKGATSAKKGEIGIIPGSQGSSSYIVRGLGNPESFMSCSHGAGRALGRKDAQRTLNLSDQQSILDSQGIIHNMRTQKSLEEAPSAYKDIDVVMANQSDLVEIVEKLTPLAVIKG